MRKTFLKRYLSSKGLATFCFLTTFAATGAFAQDSAPTRSHRVNHLFGGPPANVHRLKSSASTKPALTMEQEEKYTKAVEKTVTAEKTLNLDIGMPELLVFKRPPVRIQIPNEQVASITTISETELSISPNAVGSTVLNIWFQHSDNPGGYEILSYLINVQPDASSRTRLEGAYLQLENELNYLFPNSNIELRVVGDKVVVRGKAKDVIEAAQIIRIVQTQSSSGSNGDMPLSSNLNIDLNNPSPQDLPAIKDFLVGGASNVINMLEIPAEKQVMLRVTVAEVNRIAARSIGFNFIFTDEDGDFTIQNNTGGVLGAGNLPFSYVGNHTFQASLRAMRGLNYAKTLAEPTLVTMNGVQASFSTGGSFPVPIVTGATADGLQGVSFQDFGVNLDFTPYTLDGDMIRMDIAGEVSSRDDGGGGQISNTEVPGLDVREFRTTVELKEGETLAIAGILQTERRQQSDNIPFLGDLPFIGNFFGNREVTSSEQELVVLVTPEVVTSLADEEVSPLPGFDSWEPDDIEFYLYGRMESRATEDFRSPIQNDFDRLRWHRLEQKFLFGPSGYHQSSTIDF